MLDRHLKTTRISGREKTITKTVEQTQKFLNQNKDIITNSDKGNVTVALSETDYEQKMTKKFNHRATYKILKRDSTSKLQQKNNDLVEKIEQGRSYKS